MVDTKVLFGESIVYKRHKSKKIPLRTPEGGPIILTAKDCFAWGIRKGNFGGYQLPLALEGQDAFLKSLRDVERQCESHLIGMGELKKDDSRCILKALYGGGRDTTLYAKVSETVLIRRESDRGVKITIEDFLEEKSFVHAAVVLDSIFVSEASVSIQVKIHEIMILKEGKRKAEEPWAEMF